MHNKKCSSSPIVLRVLNASFEFYNNESNCNERKEADEGNLMTDEQTTAAIDRDVLREFVLSDISFQVVSRVVRGR